MIPPEGRDVQCSNCSTTWYQPGRRTDRQPEAGITPPPPGPPPEPQPEPQPEPRPGDAATAPEGKDPTPVPPPEPEPEPEVPPEPEAEPEAKPEPEAEPEPEPEGQPAPAAATTRPMRREIAPAVLDILRAEADREARLRQAEARPVETQDEMPLDAATAKTDGPTARTDLDDAVDVFAADATTTEHPVAARDLFPDIEQINSSLRDTGDRSGDEADASDIDTLDIAPRRRRGTRLGFLLTMAMAAAGLALYGNADWVAARLPGLVPVIDSYVAGVDAARIWLDEMVKRLGALAAEAGGDQN